MISGKHDTKTQPFEIAQFQRTPNMYSVIPFTLSYSYYKNITA